jgi:hypothetical protein
MPIVPSGALISGSAQRLKICNTSYVTGVSGVLKNSLEGTGQNLISRINSIEIVTGLFSGEFYPLKLNPSGFVTGSVVRPTETGIFATLNRLNSTGAFLEAQIAGIEVGSGSSSPTVPISYSILTATVTFTNMAAGLAEMSNGCRYSIDLTNANQMRYSCFVPTNGAATAKIGLKVSTNGSAWTGLGVFLPMSGVTTLTRNTAWETVPAVFKTDLNVRVAIGSGDGVADPVVRGFMLQIK